MPRRHARFFHLLTMSAAAALPACGDATASDPDGGQGAGITAGADGDGATDSTDDTPGLDGSSTDPGPDDAPEECADQCQGGVCIDGACCSVNAACGDTCRFAGFGSIHARHATTPSRLL